ncbi:MAG TPA: putative DNA-binding domain-containing protein [Gammaproteobacteria bacterium]|nr:putative DNA-binding domain-containing protein [Gammaproteobacteria bacterium]
MDSFSDAIRARHAAQGSVALYQHLLSTSIGAIIRSCYTRFFQCLTIEYAQDLIGDFIHTHSCTRPMHHQLPTEFLQFIQTLTLPTGLKKIVEYEWLEWSAEICEVSPVSPIYPLPHITTQILMLSPAVSLVALPFDLDALSLDFVPIAGAQNYYRLIYTDKMLRVRHRAIQPYLARLIQVFQQTGVQKTVEQILDDFILECQNRLEKSFITQVLMGLYEEHILVIPPHSKGLK